MAHVRGRVALAWVSVLALAGAVRLVPWRCVFTPEGIRFLADGDPYYHVLRAQRIAAGIPNARWMDPSLEHPLGAAVPWPPLLDDLIAGLASLAAAGAPNDRTVALVSAWAPVVFGLGTVGVFAAIVARLWGTGAAIGAAVVLSLSPTHVFQSMLGRPDHHVVEIFGACSLLLAWTIAWSSPPRSLRGRAGIALTAVPLVFAFWVWPGSVIDLVLLAGIATVTFVIDPQPHETSRRMVATLAIAFAVAACALGASLIVFAPPGRWMRMELTGISGFHVLLVGAFAVYAGLLAAIPQQPRVAVRCVAVLAAACGAGLAAIAAAPGALVELSRAFAAVGVKSSWYAGIGEFAPIVLSTNKPLPAELSDALGWFGATPVFAAIGARELRARWRDGHEPRPHLIVLASWAVVTIGMAVARHRFVPYAAPPLALLAWLGIGRAVRMLPGLATPGWSVAFRSAAVAACCAGVIALWRSVPDPFGNRAAPVLQWLAERPVSAEAAPGVLADWSLGHHVQYFARRPVVASPFGTELRGGGFEDAMAFLLTQSEERAESILAARAVGHVLASDPGAIVAAYWMFAPAGEASLGEAVPHWRRGLEFKKAAAFTSTMMNRLHVLDGGSPFSGGSSLRRLRLLHETDLTAAGNPEYKLYEVVAGAPLLVSGAQPHSDVTVTSSVRTNTGRSFTWRSSTRADATGRATLRVPYATGTNGVSIAEPYEVRAGVVSGVAVVPDRAVLSGTAVALELSGSGGSDGARSGISSTPKTARNDPRYMVNAPTGARHPRHRVRHQHRRAPNPARTGFSGHANAPSRPSAG